MARAYRELYPTSWAELKLKNGETIYTYSAEFITADISRQLVSDAQSVYKPIFSIKLAYGKKFVPNYNCSIDDIIEVEIIVNGGGSIIYKPKELMLF